MPTVSTTLKMFDVVSGPMKGIIQSMNLMVSAMSQMQNAANQNTNIDKTLTAAKDSLINAEAGLTKAIEQAAVAQDNLNKKIGQQPEVKIPKVQQPEAEPAWESAQNIELFKTNGTNRLKSEMLDAHNMMSKLQAEQAGISIRASSMNILSPEAQQDIENAYQRMRAVYNEMEAIGRQKNILKGKLDPSEANRMNSAYETLRQELNSAIGAQQNLNAAMKRGDLSKINSSYKQLIGTVDSVDKHIRDNISAQNQFNKSVEKGTGSANNLWQKIKGIGAAYLLTQGAKKGIEATDAYISTQARLNNMNYGGQTTEQLQGSIFAAANRSRGDYETMAGSVSKMGLLARDAFSSNDELISFTELMQKSFKVSGSSTQEQQAGMYQLTQAMASGKLQGDEFRSIMENAPMMADAIAKFTGKSKGDLKKMSAEGTITADVIKNAMFKASTDINAKFEKMPMTFSDVATNLKNQALQTFAPVMEKINKALNSPAGQAFVNNISNAISFAAIIIEGLLDTIMWIGNAVQQNWGIIEPILIAAGLILAVWAYQQIPMLIGKLWLMVSPILAQAGAWMLANWPILLVVVAIGLLLYAMLKCGDTVVKVVGVIGGIFGVLFAFLFNKFAYFANIVLSVAEFIANVFIDPVYAIKKLFYDLSINALSFLTNIAKGIENIINKIPGLKINMTGGMENLLNTLEKERDSLKSDKDVVKLMRFEQIDYGDAFNKGQELGAAAGQFAVDGVQNAFGSLKNAVGNLTAMGKSGPTIPNVGKVGEVGKVNGKVDISSEDLKTMRELAEIKNIQNYIKLTPTVKIQTGDIKNGYDVDTLISKITDQLDTQIASSAEGVYSI